MMPIAHPAAQSRVDGRERTRGRLYWSERDAAAWAVNGQGCAPGDATPEVFRRMGYGQVPGIGLLAATVPGAVPAWLTMLRDQGTWSLADVLAPAIAYARDGFPLSSRERGAQARPLLSCN